MPCFEALTKCSNCLQQKTNCIFALQSAFRHFLIVIFYFVLLLGNIFFISWLALTVVSASLAVLHLLCLYFHSYDHLRNDFLKSGNYDYYVSYGCYDQKNESHDCCEYLNCEKCDCCGIYAMNASYENDEPHKHCCPQALR